MAPSSPEAWPYAGLGHAELAREGGRVEYVTYFRETGLLEGEIRLVELERAGDRVTQPREGHGRARSTGRS
ncbi:hypothetical protein [Sorangium cellulosum]|nr:hypothetical protein [Sorangium cellulosum]